MLMGSRPGNGGDRGKISCCSFRSAAASLIGNREPLVILHESLELEANTVTPLPHIGGRNFLLGRLFFVGRRKQEKLLQKLLLATTERRGELIEQRADWPVRRPLAAQQQLASDGLMGPPPSFGPGVLHDFVSGEANEIPQQSAISLWIELREKPRVVAQQQIPDPGRDFIDEIGVTTLRLEQEVDRSEKPGMTTIIKLLPSVLVAVQAAMHQRGIAQCVCPACRRVVVQRTARGTTAETSRGFGL